MIVAEKPEKIISLSQYNNEQCREILIALMDRSTLPQFIKEKGKQFVLELSDSRIDDIKHAIDKIIVSARQSDYAQVNYLLVELKIPKAVSLLLTARIIEEVNKAEV